MKMYSIAVCPKPHIGYCFVVLAETPMHALSVLSYRIRKCIKAGANEHTFKDTLSMVRKWWRIHKFSGSSYCWYAIRIMECDAIKASYDTPLIVHDRGDGKVDLTYTCNHHKLHLKLSPRSKRQRNQGPSPSEQ